MLTNKEQRVANAIEGLVPYLIPSPAHHNWVSCQINFFCQRLIILSNLSFIQPEQVNGRWKLNVYNYGTFDRRIDCQNAAAVYRLVKKLEEALNANNE